MKATSKIYQLKVSKTDSFTTCNFYEYYYSSLSALKSAMRYYQRQDNYYMIVRSASLSINSCLVFLDAKVYTPSCPDGLAYPQFQNIVLEILSK